MRNKYIKQAHFSEYKFREILRLFCEDLTATQISSLTAINRNSINRLLRLFRERILKLSLLASSFKGEIEVDGSFFGAKRKKGKGARGAYGKTIVFGVYKPNGKVYTEIVPNCSIARLQAIIKGKVALDRTIHSDKWRGYHGLVDLGYKKHYRLDHGKDEFVNGKAHINGIEAFWAYAKTRLTKFKGMNKSTFLLHLKETEFRYNNRNNNLYKLLLKNLRNNPLI